MKLNSDVLSTYVGRACSKLTVTTELNNVTSTTDNIDDDDDAIYCPMPFQPNVFSVCCVNADDQLRCCQDHGVKADYQLS